MSSRISSIQSEHPLILTGASGWFGRVALSEFEHLFGPEALRRQVVPFASSAKTIDFGSPHGPLQALPLTDIVEVKKPAGLLHLAFLTRERVTSEGLDVYIAQNRAITATVAALLDLHPNTPIITTSSGAVAALDGQPANLELDPYATLKQEEEQFWRSSALARMAVVFRVYAATGRFLKNPSLFALGDFIRQAQAGQAISIRSTRSVVRSYVHVGTMMRLAWLMMQNPLAAGYHQIDAVSHTISLLDLAHCIAKYWNLPSPKSNIDHALPADSYTGDPAAFTALLERYCLASPTLLEQILDTAAFLPV